MTTTTTTTSSSTQEPPHQSEPLIPGLPDEITETCLLRLPYPYQSLVRSVSSPWNKAITDPLFLLSKKTLSLYLPYVFVFASQKPTNKIQWQAFDPRSNRWFILPPMPSPNPLSPTAFACTSLPRQGKLFVLEGMRSHTEPSVNSLVTYTTSTNTWSVGSRMLTPRSSSLTAGSIGSKVFAAGGTFDPDHMECYDPDTDTWTKVAKMRSSLLRYDSAVIGSKMYVTEGWTWPFDFPPSGWVYDSEQDTWEEMSLEMREGWTGIGVVLDDRLFMISEHGDCPIKFYIPEDDTWQNVDGKFPCESLQRPFTVTAVEGKIYVVSYGLKVAVGSVLELNRSITVEWKVTEAPKAFEKFVPCKSQIVYG